MCYGKSKKSLWKSFGSGEEEGLGKGMCFEILELSM
jgi:hypothetical protein